MLGEHRLQAWLCTVLGLLRLQGLRTSLHEQLCGHDLQWLAVLGEVCLHDHGLPPTFLPLHDGHGFGYLAFWLDTACSIGDVVALQCFFDEVYKQSVGKHCYELDGIYANGVGTRATRQGVAVWFDGSHLGLHRMVSGIDEQRLDVHSVDENMSDFTSDTFGKEMC